MTWMRLLLLFFVCGIAGCPPQPLTPPPSPPGGEGKGVQASDKRQPIAELFGKPVYREDCLSSTAGIGAPEIGLERLVAGVVAEDFFKPQDIAVSQEEIKAFEERLKRANEKNTAGAKKEREAIDKELAGADITMQRRQELELRRKQLPPSDAPLAPPQFDPQKAKSELEAIDKRLNDASLPWLERLVLEGQKKGNAAVTEQKSFTAGLAVNELRMLKCDAILHKRYGGKVIGVQIGMKPVEAYYKLLREYEDAGKVRILDETLRAAFWKRMDDWLKQPAIPREQVDFTWPVWLSDAYLDRPMDETNPKRLSEEKENEQR